MKKATLADVAAKAGVSTTSVSRYLKQEKVREDIALKIKEAVEVLGYVATAKKENAEKVVKSKKVNDHKNYKFYILCNDFMKSRTRHVIQAIQTSLYNANCTFQVCITQGDEQLEEKYLTSAIISNVHGVIIESCSSPEFIQKQMRTTAIPVLYLNDEAQGIHSILIDEEKAAVEMGKYLIDRQHLIIRYLGIDQKIMDMHMKGLKSIYHDNHQPLDIITKISDPGYVNLYEKVKEIFAEKIDLLILQNDEMAVPVTKYFQEYHIAVPQHASMISFGGHDITRVISPTLTALMYDYNAYANDITSFMFALIEKKPMPKRKDIFQIQKGDSIR